MRLVLSAKTHMMMWDWGEFVDFADACQCLGSGFNPELQAREQCRIEAPGTPGGPVSFPVKATVHK
jgi:hypothetical protein